MNPRPRWGFLKQRSHRITALGVLDGARELALPTSYAPLGIYEDGFHLHLALIRFFGSHRREL
jgi:hypothetical protein